MRLHLKYRNIRPEVQAAAETLFAATPHSIDTDAQLRVGQQFIDTVCAVYGVDSAELSLEGGRYNRGYQRASFTEDSLDDEPRMTTAAKIVLPRFSAFRLFKHVREHINFVSERDTNAKAWAASLFYTVRPVMFRAAVRNGKIRGITARETYSSASWDKLRAAGYVFGASLTGTADAWKGVLDGTITNRLQHEAQMRADDHDWDDDGPTDVREVEDITDDDLEAIIGDSIPDEEETDEPVGAASEVVLTPENVQGTDEPTDIYSGMNRDALRVEAARLNIAGRGRMLAPELRTAIREVSVR